MSQRVLHTVMDTDAVPSPAVAAMPDSSGFACQSAGTAIEHASPGSWSFFVPPWPAAAATATATSQMQRA